MKSTIRFKIASALLLVGALSGCSSSNVTESPEAGSPASGDSICTKYADLVSQYEALVDSSGQLVIDSWLDTWGTHDALIELGESTSGEDLGTSWETAERLANSSIGQQCFSASLKDAIYASVNK